MWSFPLPSAAGSGNSLMTNTETCIDCGSPVPGGGFCRRCLRDRVRELQVAWEGIDTDDSGRDTHEAAEADGK